VCASFLVIDDDPVNLELMTYLLRAFGHTATPATSTAEALNVVRREHFDLILCDIQMPGADGFDFLTALEEQDRHTIPVIGVTALAMVGDREKVLSAGFDGYITKPIVPETFVRDIEKYLPGTIPREPRRSNAEATSEVRPQRSRRNACILIVDDVKANAEVLSLILRYDGYEVLTAANADDALQVARRTHPDLILSDINMPHGDGFDLLRRIAEDPVLRGTPIVLVSATAQTQDDIDKGLALGARRFLLRPVEPDILLQSISDCFSPALPS